MKTSKIGFFAVILFLIIIGLSLAWMRHTKLDVPFLPGAKKYVWLVEARIDFVANGGPVTVSFALPDNPPGYRIGLEQSASSNYGFAITKNNNTRRAEWTKRTASGPQTLYYKVQLIEDKNLGKTDKVNPKQKEIFWDELDATAAAQLVKEAYEKSSSHVSFVRELIKLLKAPNLKENSYLLLSKYPMRELITRLTNYAGIPSRISLGLKLEDGRRYQTLQEILEVYDGEKWVVVDLDNQSVGLLKDIFLWQQGGKSLIDVEGGKNSEVRFSMIKQTISALELTNIQQKNSNFFAFSLYSLPIEQQSAFKLFLLIPFGVLVVIFMRVIVGIKTSGTFMPVLIALSFLSTELFHGLITFVLIVSLGLLLRGYLSKLNLLMVSRIGAIIVLVISLAAIISVIGNELGVNVGLTITFFPMIIIAWTIERVSILWEEEGIREVIVEVGGSLLTAVICFMGMKSDIIRHLTFNFPELHLVVLAIIFLMGQYTGYKLTELKRFSVFKIKS
jgi:hypothetical protein